VIISISPTPYLAPPWKRDWFVYAKRPFAGPEQVLAYLSRYTHRVAISNWQLARHWVVGVETDIQLSGIDGDGTVTGNFQSGPQTLVYRLDARQELKWFGTMRGRVGLATDRFLLFGTGGLAYGATDVRARTTSLSVGPFPDDLIGGGANLLDCVVGKICIAGSESRTSIGWTAGFGFEWAFSPYATLKTEYLHVDFGEQTVRLNSQFPSIGNGFLTARFDNSFDLVRGGLNVKF